MDIYLFSLDLINYPIRLVMDFSVYANPKPFKLGWAMAAFGVLTEAFAGSLNLPQNLFRRVCGSVHQDVPVYIEDIFFRLVYDQQLIDHLKSLVRARISRKDCLPDL